MRRDSVNPSFACAAGSCSGAAGSEKVRRGFWPDLLEIIAAGDLSVFHSCQCLQGIPIGRAIWRSDGRSSKFQQADRPVGKAELHATQMAATKGGPAGAGQTIAKGLIRHTQTEFRRQGADPEPGHDEGPDRKGTGIEPAQRFAEHKRIARAIRNGTNLVGGAVGKNALVALEIYASR